MENPEILHIPSALAAAETSVTSDPTTTLEYAAFLEYLVSNATGGILLTASAIMKPEFVGVMHQLVPHMMIEQRSFIVTQATKSLLVKISQNPESPQQPYAQQTLYAISELFSTQKKMKEEGSLTSPLIRYTGVPTCTNEAGSVIRYIAEHIWSDNILVLTQSAKLWRDVNLFNTLESTALEHHAIVKRLSGSQLKNFSEDRVPMPPESIREIPENPAARAAAADREPRANLGITPYPCALSETAAHTPRRRDTTAAAQDYLLRLGAKIVN